MRDFSASGAAFSGFGFIRSNPKTILSWAVVFVGIFLVFGVLLVAGAAGSFAALSGAKIDIEKNPMAVMAVAPALSVVALIMAAVGLVLAGFIYAAVFRAYLRPEQKSFGYFRLGRDELRLALAALIFQAGYVAWLLVSSVLSRAAGGGLGGLVQIAFFVAWIFVVIRLSLFLPATFDQQRLGFAESWRLTKGHFWKMLGTYLLLVVALIILMLLIVLIFAVVIGAVGGLGALSNFESGGMPPAAALVAMIPVALLMILAYPLAAAAFLAVMMGPSVTIYRALATPASTADVFA